jgi:hypothetical protein
MPVYPYHLLARDIPVFLRRITAKIIVLMGFSSQWQQERHFVKGRVSKNAGILLANPLQSSRSTFSCANVPSFLAFKEGMWDTQISALWGWPTVSVGFLRQIKTLLPVGLTVGINEPILKTRCTVVL